MNINKIQIYIIHIYIYRQRTRTNIQTTRKKEREMKFASLKLCSPLISRYSFNIYFTLSRVKEEEDSKREEYTTRGCTRKIRVHEESKEARQGERKNKSERNMTRFRVLVTSDNLTVRRLDSDRIPSKSPREYGDLFSLFLHLDLP